MSLDHLAYMPLFRGKKFELKLLGDVLPFIQDSPVTPIIEPVTADTAPLEHVIEFYRMFRVPLGVVTNPVVGAFRESSEHLMSRVGELLKQNSSAFPVCRTYPGNIDWDWLESVEQFALIADGAPCSQLLSQLVSTPARLTHRIIPHENAHKDGQRLPGAQILLGDGFPRRSNAEYPLDEELHSGPDRLDLRSASGWADYPIVGEQYQERGIRPHTVAIHITYWQPDEGGMRVRHYLSDRTDGPEDTEGKFGEALEKLVADLDDGTCPILETAAIREFRDLHSREHCPGLGQAKLLSMQHHLETSCSLLRGDIPEYGGGDSRSGKSEGHVPRGTPR